MAGRVPAVIQVGRSYFDVEPMGCPAEKAQREAEVFLSAPRCATQSDLFGERRCPFLIFTAYHADISHRLPNLEYVAGEMRLDGSGQRGMWVMCQLQQGKDTPAGC